MDGEEDTRDPVKVHVLQGVGYIWNADDALYLRKSCGLIGAMVGGVAAFKQQNAVHGLPLQLCPEEVTLALEEGWAVLCAPILNDTTTSNDENDTNSKNKKRKSRGGYHYGDQDEDYSDFDDDDDGYYYHHHNEDDNEDQGEAEARKKVAPWQDALAHGTPFNVPTTAEEAILAQGEPQSLRENEKGKQNDTTAATATEKNQHVVWTFPSTVEERDSYLIFKDLHSRGFRITGGSKFGSDFLLYPGDPTLYHAQFCVRLMKYTTGVLPALMASACRGSFQARKHLLYASVVLQQEESEKLLENGGGSGIELLKRIQGKYKVQYMTFGPVDGFG